MTQVKRKPLRLSGYDYRRGGAYFITLCVQNRLPILSHIAVGESVGLSPGVILSQIGVAVDGAIREIPVHYPDVILDKYVIMPNHIHLILILNRDSDTQRDSDNPSDISRVICQTKGAVTKRCQKNIWQKSFYDHIIRDENDYLTKWEYIDENPARWHEDELYTEALPGKL